jgi:2-polyprenyl-6-methoxyphenol hydroxylase-like FAD-dependent oxidoreductase
MALALPARTSVVIVGGGPCGLMLANELGRRSVGAVLVDEKAGPAADPRANATQARTMEHFRRLGFADEVRGLGLPPDFPTDVAYFTRFATHELARFRLPSAREAKVRIRQLAGSWSAAELPHRGPQKMVERVLRRHAEALPAITVRHGCRLRSFVDTGAKVVAEFEDVADGSRAAVEADFLVGADGARSTVRQHLGWRYRGEAGIQRDFMGGRMLAVHLRCPAFYAAVPHSPAWMNVCFNPERRAFMAAIDGRGEFAFHTQLRDPADEDRLTDDDARAMFHAAVGLELPIEILSRGTWTAGHCLVAERFGKGRVFIAGDAAHLFTPTGGLGYNTAIEDAVNLGWKLAAVVRGRAPPALLDSYEAERRPLAERNTGYAKRFADSLGLFQPVAEIEDETPQGAAARGVAGAYLDAHGRAEFDIPGITLGGRYDGSPIVVGDGTRPPPDAANVYRPTACPGGRAPHLWLDDGASLYDRFGFEWTLLRLGDDPPGAEPFVAAARRRGLELTVLALPGEHARDLYGADLALIRPDQIVAWRGAGTGGADVDRIVGRASGGP